MNLICFACSKELTDQDDIKNIDDKWFCLDCADDIYLNDSRYPDRKIIKRRTHE